MNIKFQVRCKKYEESIITLQKALNIMMTLGGNNAAAGRSAAGLIMVHLMLEDHIAATKAFDSYGVYCDGETTSALRKLLLAFDEQDGEAAKEAINSKAVKNFDIDFARLAKHIVLPDSDELEAAAAKLGAERDAAVQKEKDEAIAKRHAEMEAQAASGSSAADPEDVVQQQKALEEDGEDDLC